MNIVSEIDQALLDWRQRGFNESPVWRVPQRRGMTGLTLLPRADKSLVSSAAAIRSGLRQLARRSSQVVVRISGGGHGMRQIRAHWSYITRNGQLVLEDQHGERLQGQQDLQYLGEEWRSGGLPIADVSSRREAFNVVLSMPAGADARAVRAAAVEFAVDEFIGHQYVLVLHTPDTDPYPDPSPNPHVHLCVKALGEDGVRLNPRKNDLRRWRERFAQRLREHGIDAAASSRIERLQGQRGIKQSQAHMRSRGEKLHMAAGLPAAASNAWGQLERMQLRRVGQAARILAASSDGGDRHLAVALATAYRAKRPDRDPPLER